MEKLVESFTGGDPEISAGLKETWADRTHWPATLQQQTMPFNNQQIWDMVGQTIGFGRLPSAQYR